jgi:hypothetical protein
MRTGFLKENEGKKTMKIKKDFSFFLLKHNFGFCSSVCVILFLMLKGTLVGECVELKTAKIQLL